MFMFPAGTAEALVRDPRNQPLLNSQNESCNMQCFFTYEAERARLRCSTHPCSSFRLCCCSFGIGCCFGCHFFHNTTSSFATLRAQYSFTLFTFTIHSPKAQDKISRFILANTCKNSAKATESTSPPVLPHLPNIKCTSAELKDEKCKC